MENPGGALRGGHEGIDAHAIRPTAETSKSSAITTAGTANAIMVLSVSVVTMTAFGTLSCRPVTPEQARERSRQRAVAGRNARSFGTSQITRMTLKADRALCPASQRWSFNAADRFDPLLVPAMVDVLHPHGCGRSSEAADNVAADYRIDFDRCSSRLSASRLSDSSSC